MVSLQILGFDANTSRIYNFLLQNPEKTLAKTIMEHLKIPTKAVYASLQNLEQNKLIETSDDYPKRFVVINPDYTLHLLVEGQVEQYNETIRTLKDELDKAKTMYLEHFLEGTCARNITFHYFRQNTDGAKGFLKDRFEEAEHEILIDLVPESILCEYYSSINKVAKKNIWVGIYLVQDDKFDMISNFIPATKVFLVDPKEKQYVNVDNRLFIASHIFIDRKVFISLIYDPNSEEWFFSSFIDRNTVESMKGIIRRRQVQDAREFYRKQRYFDRERLLDLLKADGDLSKQQVAQHLGISGVRLNGLLKNLQQERTITIQKTPLGKGRPQERIVLI